MTRGERSPRLSRPQRRRIFVGGEGESESSCATLLGRLVEARHRDVHIDAVTLGGGDPLATVQAAVAAIRRRTARGEYSYRAILLDADALGRSPERDTLASRMATENRVALIWQEPCHEALLLRHLSASAHMRPTTTKEALDRLRRLWPEYRKATPAARLVVRLDREAILRAARTHRTWPGFWKP